uniref:polynucleotide adenylyltransferase n=1 Tax=Meloidogyne enterolobii TaxID=390850 RepID=A0A6V7UM08_MELEN|nr:unnamed protein product [Meloidogyne enterolobii]
MLSNWNEKSKLLISGSYLLKANTPDSDFDCLVVVPNNGNINNYFYGNSECNLKEKNCFDRSLFCIFCLHSKTNSIAKISGRVPLIKINFMEAEFDLLLVSLPKNSFDKLIALNEPKIEKVDEAIATYILERIGGIEAKNNGQLWPLSGYRANLRLYELTVNSRKTFTMLLQTIKFWTKNHYIYGSKFGFLNGSAIAIMTCKIILDFPANSVPFLIKKFFDIYSKWEWPKPVEIIELPNKKYNEIRLVLDWFGTKEVYHRHLNQFHVDLYPWLLEHSKLQWVVLNPGFPTQNTTFNVNKSTAEILKLEFLEAAEKLIELETIYTKMSPSMAKTFWKNWLKGKYFTKKYKHYLSINCMYKPENQTVGQSFCDFVETRIRLQILFSIENIEEIEYCHANPIKIKNKCLNKNDFYFGWNCIKWLIGIKEKENKNINLIFNRKKAKII